MHRLDLPTSVLLGRGAFDELPAQAQRLGLSRALLVTDPGVVMLGWPDRARQALETAGVEVELFDQVQPDPTDGNVLAGYEVLRACGAQGVVAIGGGSPIDAAKAIAMLANNPPPIAQYEGLHRVPRGGLPVIAIPTTAGTGSECTKVAVITDAARDVKMMLLDAHLTPRVALVDYRLSMSMPPALTAAVGVDTLTHGIEAYVSAKAGPLTDPLALACIRLVGQHLRAAFHDGPCEAAREGMMTAATLGGMAFPNASVCLVHGMSRPIGAVFHVPHGLSNAVLLPTITAWSLRSAETRYATIARTLGCATDRESDARAAESLVAELEALNAELQLPRLRDCPGVTPAKFRANVEKMADDALASGSPGNNPRVPTRAEVIELYERAW